MTSHQSMARGLIGGDMTTDNTSAAATATANEEEKVEEGAVDCSRSSLSPSSLRSSNSENKRGSLKAESVDPLAPNNQDPIEAVLIDDNTNGNDEETPPLPPPSNPNQNGTGDDEPAPPLDENLTSLLNSNSNSSEQGDGGKYHDFDTPTDIVKPSGRSKLRCYWVIYTIGIMRIFFGGAFIGGAISFYKVATSRITRMISASSSSIYLAGGLGNGGGDLNRELQYSWGMPTFAPSKKAGGGNSGSSNTVYDDDSGSSNNGDDSGSSDFEFDGSCSFAEMNNKTYSPEALAEYNNLVSTLSDQDPLDWKDLPLFMEEFNRHCKDSGGSPLKFTFVLDKDCNWGSDNTSPRPIDEPFCFDTDCDMDEAQYVTRTQYFVDLDPRCHDNIQFTNCTSLDISTFVESSAATTEYNEAIAAAASSGDDFFDWEKLTLGMKEVEEYCMNTLGGNLFKLTFAESTACPWVVSEDDYGNKVLRPVNLPTCFSKSCSLNEVRSTFTTNFDDQACRDNIQVEPGSRNSLGGRKGSVLANSKLPTYFFGIASAFLLVAEMLEFLLGLVDKNVPRGKGRNVHNILIFAFNCPGSILLAAGGVLSGFVSLADNKYSGILWIVGGILLTIGNVYDIIINFCARINYRMYVLVAVSKIVSTIANLVIAAGGGSSLPAVTGSSSYLFYPLLVLGGVCYIIHGILFIIGFVVPGASCLCQCN